MDVCGGYFLVLEVIGCFLFDKKDVSDERIWMDVVKMLKENCDIIDKLKISYIGLLLDGD